MGGRRSQFSSPRFATPSPLLTKHNRDYLGAPLLCVEMSFLVTVVVLVGIYISRLYSLTQTISTVVASHSEGFDVSPQGCSLSLPVQAVSSGIVPKSSFKVLEWSSTAFSPIASFQREGIRHFGPGSLLDDDTAASCFAFASSRGGAVLVSNSEKYHITQFTLDNSVINISTGSRYYPKEGALWGLFEGALPLGLENTTTSFVTEGAIYILIGSFCFSPEQGPIQTFAVEADVVVTFPAVKFTAFYLEVSSNWGGSHTCICRLSLHGTP